MQLKACREAAIHAALTVGAVQRSSLQQATTHQNAWLQPFTEAASETSAMHILQTLLPSPESLAMPIDAATRLAGVGNQLQFYRKASTIRATKRVLRNVQRVVEHERVSINYSCGYVVAMTVILSSCKPSKQPSFTCKVLVHRLYTLICCIQVVGFPHGWRCKSMQTCTPPRQYSPLQAMAPKALCCCCN
jgi:hypothetical protein